MGFFDRALGVLGGTPGPTDDFWYNAVGQVSASGLRITPEGAQKVSAFYRGVDLLSTSMAMLPLNVYRRLPDEKGAEAATDHPLYDLLHRKPNGWQNSFQWRRLSMRHLILRGNAYSRIIPGRRGFADQLWPMSPDNVKPVQDRSTGRVSYHERQPDGTTKTYLQEEVFHLCGPSDDGIEGIGIIQWAKDSIGLALATEGYAQRLFSQGPLYGAVLELPQKPDDEAINKYRASFKAAQSGLGNAHGLAVTWAGAKMTRSALTGEETQFIASRKFSIDDIARWLGVPPHMIGSLERSTNNNIEHQGQEFVTYSLGPWLTLFEQAGNDQLITRPEAYFVEFVRDALVRGDIAARWGAYQIAVSTGTVTRNEVRRKENMKSLEGLDKPLDPAFLSGKQSADARPAPRRAAPPEDDEDDEARARGAAIVEASAARILRTEAAAVQKAAVRHADNSEAFAVAVSEFYASHAGYVAKTLLLPLDRAKAYCAGQCSQALADNWPEAVETWQEPWYAAGLAAIALEVAA